MRAQRAWTPPWDRETNRSQPQSGGPKLKECRQLLQSHRREWLDGFDDKEDWIQFMRDFPYYSAIAEPFQESLPLLDRFPTISGVLLQSIGSG